MSDSSNKKTLENARRSIARTVRELRTRRKLTQGELARILGLSQNRLSEVERGHGSFTGEQLLILLRLFNVPVSEFDPEPPADRNAQLQNALARLGASHLRESESVLASDELRDVTSVVREALLVGEPRLVTATAPVLALHIDRATFARLDLELRPAGLDRRVAWLADNLVQALQLELVRPLAKNWTQAYRRAEVVLDTFLDGQKEPEKDVRLDVLDPHIRSRRTVAEVKAAGSKQSLRWRIVTGLQPEDFARALEQARAGD